MNWGEFLYAHAIEEGVLLMLLVCSAFFSGSETAMFSLTRGQLHHMRAGASRIGHLIARLMNRPQRVLNTLLLGNMIVNVAYSASAALIIFDLEAVGAPAYVVAAASLVPVLVLILAGEVAPKMIAYVVHVRWAEAVALPLYAIGRVLRPLLWALDVLLVAPLVRILAPRSRRSGDVTGEELSALLQLSARRGVISHDVGRLIQEIRELTDIRVADVMVPRVDMVSYDVDGPREGLVRLFRRTHLRKIPVYRGDLDGILGVVHAKRLVMNPEAPLDRIVTPLPFVPTAVNLEQLLRRFRDDGTQTAVVVDEYGGTAGLIALEDVLEEIVGDIADRHETDTEPAVVGAGEHEYLIDGDLAIHEWVDAFAIELSSGHISTIGGFVTSLLDRLPRVGDTAAYRNLRFTVESMQRRRIGKLRVKLMEAGT